MDTKEDDLHMLDAPPTIFAAGDRKQSEASLGREINTSNSQGGSPHPTGPINGFQDSSQIVFPVSNGDASLAVDTQRQHDYAGSRAQTTGRELLDRLRTERHPYDDKPDFESLYGVNDDEDDIDDGEHERPKPYTSFLPSGYCYDVRMRYHCELEPPKERRELHPEDPRRIFKIFQKLCVAGLIKNEQLNQGYVIPNPLVNIPVRPVTEAEVELVHDKSMYDRMKATKMMHPEDLLVLERAHDSIYFNTTTFNCALLSAGGTIETCRAVVSGKVKNAIAIVRPPGHHAECSRPMGFCIFDNVAIAAKVCMEDFKDTCRKVLILDWDVHHGNGIQQAFESDPNVLYISLHVHEDGNFYPPGPYGDHLHCGRDAGLGKNVNVPWPTKGMGDAEYFFAFQHVVMPIAAEFSPDLVIIAAGFDAAEGDQLGGCHVTPTCYAHMTHLLMSLAKGKLVVALEGGYNLQSISNSALAVTRTLVGEIPDPIEPTRPQDVAIQTVTKVAMQQSKYWSSCYPKDLPRTLLEDSSVERMHDVVRDYQASRLEKAYNMHNLIIHHEKLSKSFENQVLATPEVIEIPNSTTKKLELHNTLLADSLRYYIDWAIENGIAVIDANVPKHLSGGDEDENYADDSKHSARTQDVQKLAIYLWDNYIHCNDATQVFFLGVGAAYQGIVYLMNNRTQQFTDLTTGLISLINGNLVAAGDQLIYDNPKWYRSHSLNLVARDHLVWELTESTTTTTTTASNGNNGVVATTTVSKKSARRYGNLVKSEGLGLHDMLVLHKGDVTRWIGERVEGGLPGTSGSGAAGVEDEREGLLVRGNGGGVGGVGGGVGPQGMGIGMVLDGGGGGVGGAVGMLGTGDVI